jgi:tight adherence protein B
MTTRFETLKNSAAQLFQNLEFSYSNTLFLYLSNAFIWLALALLALPFWESALSFVRGYFVKQSDPEKNSEASETAFVNIDLAEIRKTGLIFSALIALLCIFAKMNFLIVIAIFGIVNFLLPKFLFFKAKEKFKDQFDAALPDALMGLSSSLQAGLTIQQALEVSAKISARIFAAECEHCLKQYAVGVNIDKALDGIRKRVPTASANMAFGALVIGRQLGGPLPVILKTISETIRERLRVEGRLKVLTAQGRAQGGILCSAPIFVGVGTAVWSPEKFAMLTDTPVGQILFAIALFLWFVGVGVTWKVMQLDV